MAGEAGSSDEIAVAPFFAHAEAADLKDADSFPAVLSRGRMPHYG